ncbi:MAG: ferredoxin-NADP reductase [Planctomycetota bacterium]|jgi:ferredoxin-NADP reductase
MDAVDAASSGISGRSTSSTVLVVISLSYGGRVSRDRGSFRNPEAWGQAYGVLVSILANTEGELYAAHEAAPGGWMGFRQLEVIERKRESDSITSFYLRPPDGGQSPRFKPGQYLAVRVPTCEHNSDNLKGARTPILLLSGGVGLTPMLSMLHGIQSNPVTFLYGALDGRNHALREEVIKLAAKKFNARVHFRYSAPPPSLAVVSKRQSRDALFAGCRWGRSFQRTRNWTASVGWRDERRNLRT